MLYGVYTVCDIIKQMKETNYLAHNALYVIKLASKLYRVVVIYSLHYLKLKQTYQSYSFIIFYKLVILYNFINIFTQLICCQFYSVMI